MKSFQQWKNLAQLDLEHKQVDSEVISWIYFIWYYEEHKFQKNVS